MNARHEEAAQIATEFISSLENLPQETQYLLEEIKHLDVKSEELTAKIAAETKDHFQHPRKNAGSSAGGKDATVTVPAAVGRMYDELDALAAEKVDLSGRLVRKLERALARLQHDLQRVLELERGSDEPGFPPTQEFLDNFEKSVRQIVGLRDAAVKEMGIRTPTPPAPAPVSAAPSPAPAPAAAPSKSAPSPQKKRKTTPSVSSGKAAGAVPVVAGGRSTRRHTPAPSRSSQPPQKTTRSHDATAPTKRRHAAIEEEKENEESENEEDNKLYCYCNEASYGEMIACENPNCPMEWFHLPCTGLKHPLPKKWYCDECRKTLGIARAHAPAGSGRGGRKGRKKQ